MNMQNDPRQSDLAKIHLAIKELGWDDDIYRAVLWTIARVRSAKDLDWHGRQKVLAHLKAKGWKPRPAKAAGARQLAADARSRKIRALWLTLHQDGIVRDGSEKALASYVKRMTGVEALQWLDGAQANRVIEALKAWGNRAGG